MHIILSAARDLERGVDVGDENGVRREIAARDRNGGGCADSEGLALTNSVRGNYAKTSGRVSWMGGMSGGMEEDKARFLV